MSSVVTRHERAHCVGDFSGSVDDEKVKNAKSQGCKVPTDFADVTLAYEGSQLQAHKINAEPPDTATLPPPLRQSKNAEQTFKKVQQIIELFEAATLKENVQVVENLWGKSGKSNDQPNQTIYLSKHIFNNHSQLLFCYDDLCGKSRLNEWNGV